MRGTSFDKASQPVPEPLTILGAGTAVAFAAAFKIKLKTVSKK
ncbi:MAG: PEP-CTERM sorting domain-containing protein [Crocosphaera sp.]|nr:PEP-CTERM sorting domain-containing protein [Crocosphaera sp.]